MKRICSVMGIILAAVCFSACAEKKVDSNGLEFPGMKWGMVKDEAFEAAGIKDEDVSDDSTEASFGSAYIVEGYEAFGEKSDRASFSFFDMGNGEQKLCAVFVEYPKDADMDRVLEQMKKAYGDTVPKINVFGQFQELGIGQQSGYDYEESEHLKLWSGATIEEMIPEGKEDDYMELWQEQIPSGTNSETWEDALKNAGLEIALWTDDSQGRGNGVYFMAYNLLAFNELASEFGEQ